MRGFQPFLGIIEHNTLTHVVKTIPIFPNQDCLKILARISRYYLVSITDKAAHEIFVMRIYGHFQGTCEPVAMGSDM